MYSLENRSDDSSPLNPFKIDFPNFTILTGYNGAGKTILLNNISRGLVKCYDSSGDLIENRGIKFLGYPSSINAFTTGEVKSFRLPIFAEANNISIKDFSMSLNAYKSVVSTNTLGWQLIEQKLYTTFIQLLHADEVEVERIKNSTDSVELVNLYFQAKNLMSRIIETVPEVDREDIPVMLLGGSLSGMSGPSLWFSDSPFELKLETVFENWRHCFAQNVYQKYLQEKGLKTYKRVFDDTEFVEMYGPRPWVVVNELLTSFGSDLKVQIDENALVKLNQRFRELNLIDSKGNSFPANRISSGEKIIFLIVICLYMQSSNKMQFNRPELVLFDEIDAHLHPSLTGKLLKMLDEQFVQKGTRVIFTTHSPTTVALSAEGSIVVMEKYKTPKLATRKEAVNILLADQAKAFLDMSGEKIVFVEDQSDAKIFSTLQSHYNTADNHYSIIFKSLSRRSVTGTEGGGKDKVKKIISELGANRNVFGLIDYDNKEKSKNGVFVLCEYERYGVENLLLDPRIVCFILLRTDTQGWAKKFEIPIKTSNDFLELNEVDSQRAIDKLTAIVFEGSEEEKNAVVYTDSMSLMVSQKWLRMNGHELMNLLEGKLRLKKKANGDVLLEWIAKQIILEARGFLPQSFHETIEKLRLA